MEYNESMKHISSRTILGALVIVIGVALLLSSLNIWNFGEIVSIWWPLAVIVMGIIIFINDRSAYLWALLIVAIGVVWQLNRLEIIDVSIWSLFWPLFIILIGVSLLMSRKLPRKQANVINRQNITAILGGTEQREQSQDYQGSKVTAVLGGVELDLRQAKILKEATIEVFAFWGGVEIIVPEDVIVKNNLSNILAGTEHKMVPTTKKNAPVLNIIGDVVMAGVEIKH